MDTAEYLPWCQKIDESKKLIAELKDYIDDVKAADEAPAAPGTACGPTLRTRSPRAEDAAAGNALLLRSAEGRRKPLRRDPEIKIEVAADSPRRIISP